MAAFLWLLKKVLEVEMHIASYILSGKGKAGNSCFSFSLYPSPFMLIAKIFLKYSHF